MAARDPPSVLPPELGAVNVVPALAMLVVASYLLRLALVAGGGPGFWPDESRFVQAVDAARLMATGDVAQGLRAVAGTADHLGFKLLALVPAAVQVASGQGLALSAAFVALASALNVLLVYGVARRAGADAVEAFGAALALACSNAMFYWARHLMPYDVAMTFALLLLAVALKRAPRARDAFVAGLLGFAVFVTYNGYWTMVAVGFAIHVLAALPDVRACVGRSLVLLAGFALAAAALAGAAWLALGVDLVESWRGFATTVTQGDFDEGHVIVAGWLWEAERAMVVVWALAALSLPLGALLGARIDARAWLWLGAAMAVLAALVAGSNLLGVFTVYGRLVRQAVPFLALLCGYVLFGPGRRRWQAPAAAMLLVAIAATNFATPLSLTFPPQFAARAQAAVVASGVPPEQARLVNAGFVWPMPDPSPLPAGARVLLEARHPLSYGPYLYEGFDRRQRAAYHAADLTMRLVAIE